MHKIHRFAYAAEAGFLPRAMAEALDVAKPSGNCEPHDYLAGTSDCLWKV